MAHYECRLLTRIERRALLLDIFEINLSSQTVVLYVDDDDHDDEDYVDDDDHDDAHDDHDNDGNADKVMTTMVVR